MTRRGRSTIQHKLLAATMITSGIVLVITCSAFVVFERISFRRQMVRTQTTRAEIIAANSTAALAFQNEADATEVLASLQNDPHVVSACLYDRQGRPFATYPATARADAFPRVASSRTYRFEPERFVLFQPVRQGHDNVGTLYLESDLRAMAEQLRLDALVALLVAVGAILVALGLSNSFQKRISQPILSLAGVARRVSEEKDYAVRAPKLSDDETGQLTEAFNEMLDQIQRGDEAVRMLNADLERRVQERTADLEASNKELESFSYSVSHDLRAPLRAIDGFSRALTDDYDERLDDTARGYLERVRAATGRMSALIDDLLNLSRTSRREIRCEEVDLSALAQRIADEIRQQQPERAPTVSFVIEEDLTVNGDGTLLGALLDNLLRNAWKFTSKHPSARIELGRTEVDGTAAYFIRDDGAGFDMAHSELLFRAFQRLHRQTDFEGTGIGLATVQRIVARHRGRLWADGAVEQGATFYFTLWENQR